MSPLTTERLAHDPVKIVATLGPASSDVVTIRALVDAGANVFRLNMSHGTHDEQRARYQAIRQVEQDYGRPISVLADLQGPKIRCGQFAQGPHLLEVGQDFCLDDDPVPGDATRVQLPHPEILDALQAGDNILVNDGKIRLKVVRVDGRSIHCNVLVGGEISDRKGINLPDTLVPMGALTDKDLIDLEFACELGADWIALSFVQRASDLESARNLIGSRAVLVAKIEKPAALDDYANILNASDAIMVARGDLGVELPAAQLPPLQKRLVSAAHAAGKPVIVATQMLESMIHSPVPTRAEVSDIATALYDGADAVMLSAESAAGDFPIESVQVMRETCREVSADPYYRQLIDLARPTIRASTPDAIAAAAREIADAMDVCAVCCLTESGGTAELISRERPNAPVLVITPSLRVARRLVLYWGTQCMVQGYADDLRSAELIAREHVRELGLASDKARFVLTAGAPFGETGSTNMVSVFNA